MRTVWASRMDFHTVSGVLLSNLVSEVPPDAIARICCRCVRIGAAYRAEAREKEGARAVRQLESRRVEKADAVNAFAMLLKFRSITACHAVVE